ncbi:MAG: L,D-transpeptidase [Gammaproteobacteria bacterium]|nr:L,D-transpeptidase [Gammaproteobacteria bacterium]
MQLPANLENLRLKLEEKFSNQITEPWLLVDSGGQLLYMIADAAELRQFSVSTSKYGMGCHQDSFMTPLGAHQIAEKIGDQQQINEIFVGRVASGETAEIIDDAKPSERDLILTRILWLHGLEENKNCGEGVDSFQRYIYIHGTHEEGLLGTPASHGCIRMSNADIIDLYQQVSVGTFVYIV